MGIIPVQLQPFDKLMVKHIEFFPGIPYLILECYSDVLIVRIYFPSAFVKYREDRFNARGGLCHKACGSGRCDCKKGNVPAAEFHHVVIHNRICLFHPEYEWVVLFAFSIKDCERTSLLCQVC